jgi:chromosome segregation protein
VFLKRLDLYGFKSFASRTTFEFGSGITAIVGPNGSGKSNIADSLRWVLGEQSGRLLRAKKLDDIIYAGSAKRQRSEKVEVTMTLDNANGWLPIESAEVVISRKGTRSGDSDYFINGKRTRLRELQTLLMKAAFTQSSYAIIGQGLVETILNLRPEDRRDLIEEAADIQRYRLKIEEAQDRLRGTHENVERVKLLMKEIAPRLGQLERQAKRAGDHARLSHQLSQALRVYYEHQWHRSQEALTVARAGHDQAQAEFTQARVALETCQRELDDISAQLDEHRKAEAAAAAERDRLESRIRDLERSLAVAGERKGILEARQHELLDELEGIDGERDRLENALSADDTRRLTLEAAVEEARAAHKARQDELAGLEEEYREAQARVADSQAKAQRLETAAAEMQARARRLASGESELEKEAARLETRRRSMVNQMMEQQRLIRGHRAQEAQLLAEVAATGARRQSLEIEVQSLREQLAALESTLNERRGKLEGLQARFTVLDEAQKQVEAATVDDAISIEGALGTVYEVLRVPRGLEDAIAAALDDQLEAFVFERQAEAIAAIQSLVQQRGPRTVLLPLDGMKQVYPLNVMKEKGVLGVAARLVKYSPKFEKLINMLLGRTIVVQDTETAVKLLKRGLGTVVTTDGIVFHPTGQITGGQPQAAKPFVLGYERDLETLPKEIDRIQRSIAVTENEADQVRERLREAETALQAIVRQAEDALDHRISLQDSLGQAGQRLAQLRGEMRALVGARAGLRQQGASAQADIARLGNEREALLTEAREASETARYIEKANAVIMERRGALVRAVNEAAEAFARADGECRSQAIQKETGEAALARLEAQTSAKTVQLRGLELELNNLQETARRETKELEQGRLQLDDFLDTVLPGREGAHHLEVRQRDLHSQVISSQSRMFEAERHVLEAENEVRRWEMEVENLVTRMAEDGMAVSPEGDVMAPEAVQTRIPFWLAAEGGEEGPGGLRPISGGAIIDPEALGKEIEGLRAQLRQIGPVNVEALGDYESMRERHDFLAGQVSDLEGAEESLHRAIDELTKLMRKRFESTFEQVAKGFETNFHAFFGEGGHARLKLTDPKEPMTSGVEIEARPPGKRTHNLNQLSGGEKALTSLSLLFALLQANPSPFCVLDEVDAMLDEANVVRFANALKSLAKRTQFIIVTHNRRTIETADSIYGISMAPDAASRVLSMRLADLTDQNAGVASQN